MNSTAVFCMTLRNTHNMTFDNCFLHDLRKYTEYDIRHLFSAWPYEIHTIWYSTAVFCMTLGKNSTFKLNTVFQTKNCFLYSLSQQLQKETLLTTKSSNSTFWGFFFVDFATVVYVVNSSPWLKDVNSSKRPWKNI